MKTNLFKRKGRIAFLCVLVCLLGASENAWAHGTHHFTGTAIVSSNGTGSGKVYVGNYNATTNNDTPWDAEQYVGSNLACDGDDSSSDKIRFFALPDDDSYLKGWYTDEACTDLKGTANPYEWTGLNDGDSKTLYALFMQKFSLYYAATAEVNKGGSVKIAFAEGDVDSGTNPVSGYTEPAGVSSASVTAYFKAIPNSGYEFIGWKKSPVDESYVSFEPTYSEAFTVTSSSEASPTTFTMYAYFEKESDVEARLYSALGTEIGSGGSFTYILGNAGNGTTIVLMKDVNLGSTSQTITKSISIDFNNKTISGSANNLITIDGTAITVNFSDASDRGEGGISLLGEVDSELNAVCVSRGTLNANKGVLSCKNTSTEEGAEAVGVKVASGAKFNLEGAIVNAESSVKSYGVKVLGTAKLATGSINANAANNAYGVLANGEVMVTWGVSVNATTTATNAFGVVVDDADANVTINGGVITATAGTNAYAVQVKQSTVNVGGNMAAKASAGTASSAYALKQEGSSVINVETGRFYTANMQDMTAETAANLKLYGGYYTKDVPAAYIQPGVTKGELQSGNKFYTEDYRYVLTNGDNPNYVVATANGKKFSSLEDAITYANNNPNTAMTIRLEVPEYTLPAGNYTIPQKASLLVPYKTDNKTSSASCPNQNQNAVPSKAFAKLIFESGVQMDVYGIIEISGEQNNYATSSEGTGRPRSDYGHLVMKKNSKIVLSSGAEFRAWGFITGDNTKDAQGNYNMGEIDARGGAIVREMCQIYDFKGGNGTNNMSDNDHKAFPFHQYFIQNIEVPTKFRPGSSLYGHLAAVGNAAAMKIIGQDGDGAAMFKMDPTDASEDTWVRKSYSISDDRQVYEMNNSASISNIQYSFFNSNAYTLPITNNMRIHLLSGEMQITEDVVLLPGAEIIVNKKSTATVAEDKVLFLHDSLQWGTYAFSGAFAQRIKYRPYKTPTNTERNISSLAALGDARVNVKGTFDVQGSLCTTEDGARIYSTNSDAGTVKFTTAPTGTKTLGVWTHQTGSGWSTSPKFIDYTCTSAKLKNGDGSYTQTYTDEDHHAQAGDTYCYINGTWKNLQEDDDNNCVVVDKTDPEDLKYYAKPQDYVELSSNVEDPTYHVYFSKDLSRTFICIGDCQWWEVKPAEENDALAHCVHPNNDKYYYYDDLNEIWVEKQFTVTWVTRPYEELEEDQGRVVYNVDYKSTPKYLGTNPSRPMTDYYTYDFTGWLPDIVPVTDDAVYVAQFQQNDRKYMITFLDEDGSILEEALWKMGEVPAPVNEPTPSGKKLVWEPTIQAVTGEATYRATYTDIVLPAYQITFKNWDGTILQQGDVETDTIPEYTGETPTKPSLADVAFEFEGWTPDLAPVDGEAIYIAKFREKPATYTITFKRAVGNEGVAIEPAETIQELELAYGETPVCTSDLLPTKTSTEAEYYTLVWSPLITAVTGNATYTATGFAAHKNTRRLTVSAGANGQVRMADGEWKNDTTNTFDSGTSKQIEAKATTEGYSFKRWSDGNTTNPRTVTVNAAISLTAEFALNQYNITWLNENGSTIETTKVNHGVVPSHVAPTKATDESYTYTFAGWSPTPVAATTNTIYTATFNATPIEYTIRIVLNNGMSDIVYEGMHYNDEVAIGTPIKASKNGVDYTFSHWTNSADENIGATIPNVTRNEIYYAQYDTHINDLIAGNSDEANAKDLSLTESGLEASSLIIEASGTVNITSDATVTVQNLILESNGSQSGQLIGTSSARLTVNEHAYFDLTLNAQRRTWYAVAVPWAVDCRTGISIKGGRKLVLGRDFDLVYYQGDVRASEGPGYQCWKYAEDGDGDKIMHPGRAYMMYFGSEIETIRFENYDDTPFDDAVLTVSQYSASNTDDANWNGIANPRAYHATMGAGGATYGYYLNNGKVDEYNAGEGEPTYKLVNLAAFNAIVGKPLFIQAVNTNSITTTPKIAAAPRRIREIEIEEGIETVYEITFGAEGSDNKDNIFIQTVENKEDGYVLGQDLLKAGMSAKLPQMWINQYGKKLSVNTATPMNGVHEYPLTLNIPQAGDYTMAIESTQGDAETLYLLKDGNIIWNLSNGAYIGSFEKGQETSYSLRTAAKLPMTPTGIDNAVIDANGEIRKMLIDNHVYIIRGNEVYTIEGQLVK